MRRVWRIPCTAPASRPCAERRRAHARLSYAPRAAAPIPQGTRAAARSVRDEDDDPGRRRAGADDDGRCRTRACDVHACGGGTGRQPAIAVTCALAGIGEPWPALAFDVDGEVVYCYAHLDANADGLRVGDFVARGPTLGYVGSTGNAPAAAPHLHFEIQRPPPGKAWRQGVSLDPYPLLTASGRQRDDAPLAR